MSRPPHLVRCAITVAGLAACDDPKHAAGTSSATASGAATTAAPPPTAAPKPTSMPELSVDPDGPYLGGQRVNLADAAGPGKLTKIVKELPINGKPVTLQV